ncbi:MAG TPA: peptide deformylase [Candidatus Thiothrix moscowensis]|uniref:peptide deformylase n=1 Tax=unclassified Thiothrix TaxID=2636184 RepID=UPI0025F1AB0B|nr:MULTISPECIES: peptide deformylase [unclassified Thiothrix]HRJ52604.1 peptide deformylase [Candidatus Thiothrix moscowensis]HRJ92912.1 peptide deformylase [Candidatus Thiothrix moscowensis]
MAQLNILHHPDARLRKKATPVTSIDATIRQMVDDMFETMYAARGIGLAATQVNIHQRIIAIDITEEGNEPLCLINPEIVWQEGRVEHEEGCLSVPDYYDKVTRAERIRVRALDRDGQVYEKDADGLLAICIQHEMDHLDGKLFVDYLSSLKQQRVRKKMEKWEKENAKAPAKKPAQAVIG